MSRNPMTPLLKAFAIALLLAVCLAPRTARAQRSDMYQAVTRVLDAGKQAYLSTGYMFLNIGPIFGTLLADGETVEETFPFVGGKKYAFIAAGDDDERDIDLYVYGPNGRVWKDTRSKSVAVVEFIAPMSGRYRVVLRQCRSAAANSFCAMSVLTNDRANAYELRPVSVLDTLAKLEASFLVLERLKGEDVSLDFHAGGGSWLLMGAILPTDGRVFSDPKRFPEGDYIGVLVGEKSCSDANLYVSDSAQNRLIRGTDTENYSFVGFSGGDTYCLEMQNAYSARPSLLLTAILRVSEP